MLENYAHASKLSVKYSNCCGTGKKSTQHYKCKLGGGNVTYNTINSIPGAILRMEVGHAVLFLSPDPQVIRRQVWWPDKSRATHGGKI